MLCTQTSCLTTALPDPAPASARPPLQTFTSYEYMPSEYDRKTIISKFERLKNKLQQVTPAEFVVKAPPLGPRGAPAFSEFEYDLDPFSVSVWSLGYAVARGKSAKGWHDRQKRPAVG